MTRRMLTLAVLAAGALAPPAMAAGWTVEATPHPGHFGELFKGITALSSTDVWAVGDMATQTNNATFAAHFDGASWTTVPTPNPVAACQDGDIFYAGQELHAVSGTGAGDVWAVGQGCQAQTTLVEHFDGVAWRLVPSPSPSAGQDGLNGVKAITPANAWAVGYFEASNGARQTLAEHWNGGSWSKVFTPSPSPTDNVLNAIDGTSASDLWAVGSRRTATSNAIQPLIQHYDGHAWSGFPAPPAPGDAYLLGVNALSPTDVWAVGTETFPSTQARVTLVMHYDGTRWRVVESPNLDTAQLSQNILRGVAALSPTDVWAIGIFSDRRVTNFQHRTFALHWNGSTWSLPLLPSPGKSAELEAIARSPQGGLFAAGVQSPNPLDTEFQVYQPPRSLVLSR